MEDTNEARVADLMSFSVQTVGVDTKITDLIQRIRRIGHEGYPVIENGQVVGLLTLRDADKALEYGLETVTVRDVMHAGRVTLHPDDPVSLLVTTMIESEWGQIPVVDDGNRLIGIVTRTDLIKYWGRAHPTTHVPHIDPDTARRVLGEQAVGLMERIARHAQKQNLSLYLVGGVVRDLLLERPNADIDFVVEGSAIDFADKLCQQYGGRVHAFKPFGTAKWLPDAAAAGKLGISPDHIDFATARSELYEHPTALPTVYNSGIKLDLRRRDFTINTLAVQLSPQSSMWRILDFYGGMADLEQHIIRVLHSLSFVDDPTRIIRAVRFSERLGFVIEPRTTELLQSALPMLRRITGERIRNELELLLNEISPARGLLKLEALGALKSIHPALTVQPSIRTYLETLAADHPHWSEDATLLRWYLLMAQVSADSVDAVARRLLFSQPQAEDFQRTAQLAQQPQVLTHPLSKPSHIDKALSAFSAEGLVALWIVLNDATARERIEQYHDKWRHIKPNITGHDLRERGLQPGPQYATILSRLREAWLDGEIHGAAEEQLVLKRLINEVYHDGKG